LPELLQCQQRLLEEAIIMNQRTSHTRLLMLLVTLSVITSCTQATGTGVVAPTWTEMQPPTFTSIPPTVTPTARATLTATLTPPATLEPEQAKETIMTLLQDSVDCKAPCFWGIVPRQTTLGEARNNFTQLGLNLELTRTEGRRKFYAVVHDFDNGLSITVILTIQNDLVENLRTYISPEKLNAVVPRAWSAYSPETLINQYGLPSRVDFYLDWGPRSFFDMVIYFDSVNLIVEYTEGWTSEMTDYVLA
jgi:hypothetical protein